MGPKIMQCQKHHLINCSANLASGFLEQVRNICHINEFHVKLTKNIFLCGKLTTFWFISS